MSEISLVGRQLRYTNRAFWRNPASAFFTFAFPLMFLVIFTGIFGNDTITTFGREVNQSTRYIPMIGAFAIITACYTNIAMTVAFLRDQGVLKRTRGTPMPPWAYLSARIVHSVLVAIVLVLIVGTFGALFYNADIPTRTVPALIATIAVGAAGFCALGLAITAVIPNADAAPAVVNFSILPLLFISDVFIPISNPNAWYVTVAKAFPVYHFSKALIAAYFLPQGSGFQGGDLLIVGAWGLAGLLLAVRFFSWEPRR